MITRRSALASVSAFTASAMLPRTARTTPAHPALPETYFLYARTPQQRELGIGLDAGAIDVDGVAIARTATVQRFEQALAELVAELDAMDLGSGRVVMR